MLGEEEARPSVPFKEESHGFEQLQEPAAPPSELDSLLHTQRHSTLLSAALECAPVAADLTAGGSVTVYLFQRPLPVYLGCSCAPGSRVPGLRWTSALSGQADRASGGVAFCMACPLVQQQGMLWLQL